MGASVAIPERFNVADHFILARLREGRGDDPCLLSGDETLTFSGLDALANRAVHALRALGVQPEQRVTLILPDGFDFAAGFWGAIRMGAVAVPLNTQWPAEEYRHCLADSRAKALIVDHECWPRVAPALADLRRKPAVILAGATAAEAAPAHPSLAGLLAKSPETPASEPTHRDEPAFWLYTSGSTGAPKAAVHLHHDMVYPAECFAKTFLGLRADDLAFSASKLFFAYGLGNSLYFPLATGGRAVLLRERPTPERLFEVLARFRPTVFYAVPTLFNGMLLWHESWEAERAGPRPLPRLEHLRLVVSAGEPLPGEIHRRWKARFGQEILDGIGSTEMLQTFISNPPGRSREGSTGVLVPGYEARLVDGRGREVREGEPGVLWARGESSAPCYWNRSARTRQTMIGPWVVTGDRFRRDADGYFWYEGRSDDMLKVGANWVSPVEVENVLLGHPAVAECAVVGQADGQGLIRPKAFVVPKGAQAPDPRLAEALIAHAAERLPPFKRPHWVEFRDELPKTATGKIRRFLLRNSERQFQGRE